MLVLERPNAVHHSNYSICWSWNASQAVTYSVCWFWNIANCSICWPWNASNAVKYNFCLSWNASTVINDSVCWSWKISHAVVYNICWPCNVPLLQIVAWERCGRLDLGVRIRIKCGVPAHLLIGTEGWNSKSITISLKILW